MIENFAYNKTSAASADFEGSSSIRSTGAYTLRIYQAAVRESQNPDSKASWVDFVLGMPDSKAKAICRLIIKKKDGSDAFGLNFLNAMLGLLGVENAPVQKMKVFHLNGNFEPGYRIPAIESKVLGFFLQYVEDRDEDGYQRLNERGYPRYQMSIKAVFDPQTRQTISEKIEGKQATRIDYLAKTLQDDKAEVREGGDSFESPARNEAPQSAPAASPATVGEDIPF